MPKSITKRSLAEDAAPAVDDALGEPLWRPDDLSRHLGGIPPKTLAEWRSRGEGPPFLKIGRHVRYEPQAVRVWQESRRSSRVPAA